MFYSLNLRKVLSLAVLGAFWINVLGPVPAKAGEFRLPAPGVMVQLSPEDNSPILKGLKVHTDNPFLFDFILDKGDKEQGSKDLEKESARLIKYFLASLTIPEKDLWVNLSPYEKDRIIPDSFGLTEMGRDLLAEDYMLKQITASLIYPEGEVGKRFWKRIYEQAAKQYGTTNIPVNTFNKVWIVPDKAVVYENVKAQTAYVVESKLKVMLEQDYLALQKNQSRPGNSVNALGSKIVREIVLPELTKEVNKGRNFVQLRQVFQSLILAAWYKKKIKDSILAQVYADKKKVDGVNSDDPQEKERIYQQYLKAFKKGVYNYIKEEQDPLTQQMTPRKYFSGGIEATRLSTVAMATVYNITPSQLDFRSDKAMQVTVKIASVDHAMSAEGDVRERLLSMTERINPGKNGIGGVMFKRYFPSEVPRFLATWKVSFKDLLPYYNFQEQFYPELEIGNNMPSSFIEIPHQSEKSLELENVILTSRSSSGTQALVRLAFLKNGRPAVFKTPDESKLQKIGRTIEQALLREYISFKLGEELGIGPHVYGVYKDKKDGWGLVMDFVPGDFTEANQYVSIQTVRDLIEIRRRLYAHRLTFYNDFQFYIMPNGRIRCIDLVGLGHGFDTREESEERFFFNLAGLIERLDRPSRQKVLRNMDVGILEGLNKYLDDRPMDNWINALFEDVSKAAEDRAMFSGARFFLSSPLFSENKETVVPESLDEFSLSTKKAMPNVTDFAIKKSGSKIIIPEEFMPLEYRLQGIINKAGSKDPLFDKKFIYLTVLKSQAAAPEDAYLVSVRIDSSNALIGRPGTTRNPYFEDQAMNADGGDQYLENKVVLNSDLWDENHMKAFIGSIAKKMNLFPPGIKDVFNIADKQYMLGGSPTEGLFYLGPMAIIALPKEDEGASESRDYFSQWFLVNSFIKKTVTEIGEEVYFRNRKNIIFISPESAVPGQPLNGYTASMGAVMLDRVKQFHNAVVYDFGAGSGVLSLIALSLGASKVVLMEKSDHEVYMARALLTAQGYREDKDFYIIKEDLTQTERVLDSIKKLNLYSENKIGLINMGPWSFYGKGKANELSLSIATQLKADLVINGGYFRNGKGGSYKRRETATDSSKFLELELEHRKAVDESTEMLERTGFGVKRYEFRQTMVVEAQSNHVSSANKNGLSPSRSPFDQAVIAKENGGIDLTPANMHLQTQNSHGEIKFHLDPVMLRQFQNSPGFVPVIINIQPITDLRQFLGLKELVPSK